MVFGSAEVSLVLEQARSLSPWELTLKLGHGGWPGNGVSWEFGSFGAGLEYRSTGADLLLRWTGGWCWDRLESLICSSWLGWGPSNILFEGAHLKPGAMGVGWH